MNLTAKKVYVRKYSKSVSIRRDVDGENTTILCNGCNATSYSWGRVGWKYFGG